MRKFLQVDANSKEIFLYLKVKAGAKKNHISPSPHHLYIVEDKEYLIIHIQSPPIDGKANKMIIAFLSDLLSIPKSQIKIISGLKSSFKALSINSEKNKVSNLQNKLSFFHNL